LLQILQKAVHCSLALSDAVGKKSNSIPHKLCLQCWFFSDVANLP